MRLFSGLSADAVWRQAAEVLLQDPDVTRQPSRTGLTREVLPATLVISDPCSRWIVSRRPALNPAFALVEVLWILGGRRDAPFLNFWNRALPTYSGNTETYHGAYGFRLRHHFEVDQLELVYQVLLHNPDSRQVALQMWDPRVDLPDQQGQPRAADIPCNVLALPKLRAGKLTWLQVLRSNDVFRGMPYNFIQFTCLQEILAGWLGANLGTYTHVSDSLHLYERDVPMLEVDNTAAAPNTDSLALCNKEFWEVHTELCRRLDEIILRRGSQSSLQATFDQHGLPKAYENLARVVVADVARRQGRFGEAQEFMDDCTNPALKQVWQGWWQRTASLTDHTLE